MTRDHEGNTALIIYRGSLSCWLDRCVITDDELTVLIICACSSRNVLINITYIYIYTHTHKYVVYHFIIK